MEAAAARNVVTDDVLAQRPAMLGMSRAALTYGSAIANFCEVDFAVSQVVVEWWNTVSSVVLTLIGVAGLFGAIRYRHPAQFKVLHFLLICIGLGSVWFHATMSFAGQMFDEIPMMLFILALVYALVEVDLKLCARIPALWALPYILTAYGTATVAFMLFVSKEALFFRLCFGVMAFVVVWQEYRLLKMYASPVSSRLFYTAFVTFMSAFVFWNLENAFCSHVLSLPFNPQLHAVWHVLCGVASHYSIVWLVYIHAILRSRKAELRPWVHTLLPVVVVRGDSDPKAM